LAIMGHQVLSAFGAAKKDFFDNLGLVRLRAITPLLLDFLVVGLGCWHWNRLLQTVCVALIQRAMAPSDGSIPCIAGERTDALTPRGC
jgi:hypothetical protein